MKKLRMLSFSLLVVLCCGVINVNADNMAINQRIGIIENKLSNYNFDFKFVNMSDNYDYLTDTRTDYLFEYDSPKRYFLNNLIRSDLEDLFEWSDDMAIDMACRQNGDRYETWNEQLNRPETLTADHDYCNIFIYFFDSSYDMVGSIETEITGSFTEVTGNSDDKEEALNLVKELNQSVSVYDIDILNHYLNYNSNSSTFFKSNNAIYEFSKLKQIKENNPDFDFFVGYEDTRRGMGYTGVAEGSTFISKDDIIYGFAYNSYNAGNVFFVPTDTPVADYAQTLETRLKEYAKGMDISIEVADYNENNGWPRAIDGTDQITTLLGITTANYYEITGSSYDLEKAKLISNSQDCDLETECIATYTYNLVVGNKTYEIGIAPYDLDELKAGTITSIDKTTGIILKTSAGNIPLDATLMTEKLNLTDTEIAYLKKLGYQTVEGYDLTLYSTILDRIISSFNSDTEILIPLGNIDSKNLKIVYINENNEIEEYDAKIVEENNQKYISFKTNHFSNYIITNKTTTNPKTFDGIALYLTLALVSCIGVVGITIYTKKHKIN